ncbi:MAG: DUF4198 domain-containing protein [Thermoplasmata archaeon]|nr:DUF4198 domain-containing protein [Thermoplasmata archaeon]
MSKRFAKCVLGTMLAITFLMASVGNASAHFNFALPNEWHMETAKANDVQLIWGHPYEGIYFDAPAITDSGVVKPDGTKSALTPSQITVDGKEAWELSFTPSEKGDYIVYADFGTIVVPEEEIAWEDHVKAIVHYKVMGGWEHTTDQIIEIVPLTRPYGLEEGFVFTGKAIYDGAPLPNAPVEIEKYYPISEVPDPLPEEPLITRETKTDTNGIFLFTLDEPGVWVACVSNTVGTEGGYDKDVRGILMIPVEERFPPGTDGNGVDLNELSSAVDDLEKENTDLNDKVGSLQNLLLISIVVAVIAAIIAVVAIVRARRG